MKTHIMRPEIVRFKERILEKDMPERGQWEKGDYAPLICYSYFFFAHMLIFMYKLRGSYCYVLNG